jgi:hypothetical protein
MLTYILPALILGSCPIEEVGLHCCLVQRALDYQCWLPRKPVHCGFCRCHEALVESGLVIHQGICLWLFSWLHVCAIDVRQDFQRYGQPFVVSADAKDLAAAKAVGDEVTDVDIQNQHLQLALGKLFAADLRLRASRSAHVGELPKAGLGHHIGKAVLRFNDAQDGTCMAKKVLTSCTTKALTGAMIRG